MAIEAIKGAGMVYQGSTSTAQIKEQAQGRTEVSSADNQVVSDSIARNIQAMNTKGTSGDSAGDAGAQGQAQLAAQKQNEKNMQLKKAVDDINKSALADQSEAVFGIHEKTNRVTIKIVDKKTKEVIAYDDVIDDMFSQVKKELADGILNGEATQEQILDILMIAKYYERIGDHATNIAEWAEYAITGVHRNSELEEHL